MVQFLQTAIRKLKGPLPLILGSLVLVLSYQNFSYHDPTHHDPKLKPEKYQPQLIPRFQSHRPANEKNHTQTETYKDLQKSNLISLQALVETTHSDQFDIREFAPNRPIHVAFNEDPFRAPEVHSNRLSDVGTVWLEREIRPLLQPLEAKWLGHVNGQLRGLFGSFKPVDDEDWPEPGEEDGTKSRDPASDPGAFPGMPSIPGMPDFPGAPSGEDSSEDDYLSLKTITPEEIKLTKANEVTIGFKHGTLVSCEVSSGQSKFKLSRPFSQSSSFDISHESADNRNSVGFRLSW